MGFSNNLNRDEINYELGIGETYKSPGSLQFVLRKGSYPTTESSEFYKESIIIVNFRLCFQQDI